MPRRKSSGGTSFELCIRHEKLVLNTYKLTESSRLGVIVLPGHIPRVDRNTLVVHRGGDLEILGDVKLALVDDVFLNPGLFLDDPIPVDFLTEIRRHPLALIAQREVVGKHSGNGQPFLVVLEAEGAACVDSFLI